MSTPDEIIKFEDLADKSIEEILDLVFFDSHYTTLKGPKCECLTTNLSTFQGALPNELCEQAIDDIDLTKVKDFETEVSSTCACQQAHFFRLKLSSGILTLEESKRKVPNTGKPKLPNFR